jgi:hypothetical protein
MGEEVEQFLVVGAEVDGGGGEAVEGGVVVGRGDGAASDEGCVPFFF